MGKFGAKDRQVDVSGRGGGRGVVDDTGLGCRRRESFAQKFDAVVTSSQSILILSVRVCSAKEGSMFKSMNEGELTMWT